ncbi:hypothetical protein [Streptomyces sp. NBC_01262]|jgi:hypothetical protein|nr:hypothetical protein [Streptomyces sp. NBC_01262]
MPRTSHDFPPTPAPASTPLPRPRLLTRRRHIDLLRLRNGCSPTV